jgi:hypothetical protein
MIFFYLVSKTTLIKKDNKRSDGKHRDDTGDVEDIGNTVNTGDAG